MVEVGTLNIKGNIDTSNIQRGQRQIRSGFRNVEEQGKSTFGSLNRLQGVAVGLGNAFGNVAAAGTGALTALAGLSPVLAPTFARLGADTRRLSIAMGEELKPAFEGVTSAYNKFVNFVSSDTPMSNMVTDLGLLVGAGGLLTSFVSKITGLKGLGKITIPLTLAVGVASQAENIQSATGAGANKLLNLIGYDVGEQGASTPFGVRTTGTEEASSRLGQTLGMGATGAAVGALAGSVIPGVGTAAGALAGGIGGLGYGLYVGVKNEYFYNTDTVSGG